ncbi:hypothetical protein APS56_00470 [Pseudalgibacter alginicilyticus]|uniref:Uncharacterized protein n=1 Tax=Pseudalgibacter alginicilyticus TaxID=1736674 RepID=A0A0P0CHF4_9FLAO|nr:hypothetical protein [Pseudalgibacter alginicilyticus]ALJ03714.1 hypothetical protein APS56_00470 [Pseudalgibacter alginicilyticus]
MILTPAFVISIIIVFILVWLFVITIDKRKWLSFLISVVLTPIVYFYLFYPMLNIFSSYHHQKHFDSEAWVEKPALRYEMTDEIINNNIFIGKSKTDIKTLLGSSEWYSWDETIKANSPNKWNYNLGFKPGAFNNMQESIEIIFVNDTVNSIKQYQTEQTFE